MIDLEMMASLLDALPPQAPDPARRQGPVGLGRGRRGARRSRRMPRAGTAPRPAPGCSGSAAKPGRGLREGSAQAHPLAQQTVMLRHSRRFGASSGSGAWRGWSTGNRPMTRALLDSPPADLFDLRLRGSAMQPSPGCSSTVIRRRRARVRLPALPATPGRGPPGRRTGAGGWRLGALGAVGTDGFRRLPPALRAAPRPMGRGRTEPAGGGGTAAPWPDRGRSRLVRGAAGTGDAQRPAWG